MGSYNGGWRGVGLARSGAGEEWGWRGVWVVIMGAGEEGGCCHLENENLIRCMVKFHNLHTVL